MSDHALCQLKISIIFETNQILFLWNNVEILSFSDGRIIPFFKRILSNNAMANLYCLKFVQTMTYFIYILLTHWGRVTHICVSKLTIIGSDNGLSPGRLQAIIWTNAGILLIVTLGTKFSEILGKIHIVSLKKMHFKMSSGKCRPFCLGLNVLTTAQSQGSSSFCTFPPPAMNHAQTYLIEKSQIIRL